MPCDRCCARVHPPPFRRRTGDVGDDPGLRRRLAPDVRREPGPVAGRASWCTPTRGAPMLWEITQSWPCSTRRRDGRSSGGPAAASCAPSAAVGSSSKQAGGRPRSCSRAMATARRWPPDISSRSAPRGLGKLVGSSSARPARPSVACSADRGSRALPGCCPACARDPGRSWSRCRTSRRARAAGTPFRYRRARIGRVRERPLRAVEDDSARGRDDSARKDVHERRLASTVVAEETRRTSPYSVSNETPSRAVTAP